jgi:hypothetical protein
MRTRVLAHVIWRACAQLELDLEREEIRAERSEPVVLTTPIRREIADLTGCNVSMSAIDAWEVSRLWARHQASDVRVGLAALDSLLVVQNVTHDESVTRDAFMQAWGVEP